MKKHIFIFILLSLIGVDSIFSGNNINSSMEQNNTLETITLGAGCFWCVEAFIAA